MTTRTQTEHAKPEGGRHSMSPCIQRKPPPAIQRPNQVKHFICSAAGEVSLLFLLFHNMPGRTWIPPREMGRSGRAEMREECKWRSREGFGYSRTAGNAKTSTPWQKCTFVQCSQGLQLPSFKSKPPQSLHISTNLWWLMAPIVNAGTKPGTSRVLLGITEKHHPSLASNMTKVGQIRLRKITTEALLQTKLRQISPCLLPSLFLISNNRNLLLDWNRVSRSWQSKIAPTKKKPSRIE